MNKFEEERKRSAKNIGDQLTEDQKYYFFMGYLHARAENLAQDINCSISEAKVEILEGAIKQTKQEGEGHE